MTISFLTASRIQLNLCATNDEKQKQLTTLCYTATSQQGPGLKHLHNLYTSTDNGPEGTLVNLPLCGSTDLHAFFISNAFQLSLSVAYLLLLL